MAPTRSQVMYWNIDLDYPARQADSISQGLVTAASKMYTTIAGLDWSGEAYTAAATRADREQTQMRVLASAFDDLAAACRTGQAAMAPIVQSLKTTVRDLEADSFTVHEQWDVSETLTNAAPDAVRANEAANQTVSLQRLAAELGWADEACAQAIRTALTAIATLAPESAGLNPTTAERDLADFMSGKATPEELERLTLATTLTEQQRADLLAGRPVDLPQEQYDYLQQLMRSMDGKSVEQIAAIGAGLPEDQQNTVSAGVANALQLMSNPQVTTMGMVGDTAQVADRGGMTQLPAPIRTLLTESPLQKGKPGDSGHGNPVDLGDTVPRADDFTTLAELMNRGDDGLAQGSDLDRGVLKQAAEIVGGANTVGETGITADNPDKLASRMLEAASGDHQAVHDFLTGDNMSATVSPGQTYDAQQHIGALLDNNWAGQEQGLTAVLQGIDAHAMSDDQHLNSQAGASAGEIAEYIGSHKDQLLHIDGSVESIGSANPKITGALGDLMSNYIPNMVGVRPELLQTGGFSALGQDQVNNIFAVMDSNPQTAVNFNTSAYAAISQLNQQFGLSGGQDSALGMWAGKIDQGAQVGMQLELDTRIKDQAEALKEKQALFDSVREGTAFAGKRLPIIGDDSTELAWKMTSPHVRSWLLGSVPEIGPQADISAEGNSSERYYNVLQGMSLASGQPDYRNDPDVGQFFDPATGKLKSYEDIGRMNGDSPETNLVEFNGAMMRFLLGLVQYEAQWDNGKDPRESGTR